MRCLYMSDLHLETQDFPWTLPRGDVLILAGDLCHARCLSPSVTDTYAAAQRERTLAFIKTAQDRFAHVLLVAGNHDHYEGRLDETSALFRSALPGVTVLDNQAVEIGGVNFFGTTLWSDFEGRDAQAIAAAQKRCGEFYFVHVADAKGQLRRFSPADALAAFDQSIEALSGFLAACPAGPNVVISHHAPSRKSLNPIHMGNGIDGAYASSLDDLIKRSNIAVWVHGHTHVIRRYVIGQTLVVANCRGLDGRDLSTRDFSMRAFFDV